MFSIINVFFKTLFLYMSGSFYRCSSLLSLQVNRAAYASVSHKTAPDPPKRVCVAGVSLGLSAFHCTKPQVLMATGCSLVVWDVNEVEKPRYPLEYTKKLKLQQVPITVLTVTDG